MLEITISKRTALVSVIVLALLIPGVAGAAHVFTDVSDGNTHSPGIEWVAAAGVSTGCGDGTTYCPDDAVTRAQMGTFMCRLAGNCGVAPSVNAAQVDGVGADGLRTVAAADVHDWGAGPATIIGTEVLKLGEVALEAPVAGLMRVDGHLSASYPLDGFLMLWIQLDDTTCSGDTGTGDANNLTGALAYQSTSSGDFETTSIGSVASVGAGPHTAVLCTVSTGHGTGWSHALRVEFVPGS